MKYNKQIMDRLALDYTMPAVTYIMEAAKTNVDDATKFSTKKTIDSDIDTLVENLSGYYFQVPTLADAHRLCEYDSDFLRVCEGDDYEPAPVGGFMTIDQYFGKVYEYTELSDGTILFNKKPRR